MITIDTINEEVKCTPSNVRLAPQAALGMQITNRADRPFWFAAPEFFRYTDVAEPAEPALDLLKGGLLTPPRGTVSVNLKTPDPGQYYYSCSELGQPPNPQSSGVLVVTPSR